MKRRAFLCKMIWGAMVTSAIGALPVLLGKSLHGVRVSYYIPVGLSHEQFFLQSNVWFKKQENYLAIINNFIDEKKLISIEKNLEAQVYTISYYFKSKNFLYDFLDKIDKSDIIDVQARQKFGLNVKRSVFTI